MAWGYVANTLPYPLLADQLVLLLPSPARPTAPPGKAPQDSIDVACASSSAAPSIPFLGNLHTLHQFEHCTAKRSKLVFILQLPIPQPTGRALNEPLVELRVLTGLLSQSPSPLDSVAILDSPFLYSSDGRRLVKRPSNLTLAPLRKRNRTATLRSLLRAINTRAGRMVCPNDLCHPTVTLAVVRVCHANATTQSTAIRVGPSWRQRPQLTVTAYWSEATDFHVPSLCLSRARCRFDLCREKPRPSRRRPSELQSCGPPFPHR